MFPVSQTHIFIQRVYAINLHIQYTAKETPASYNTATSGLEISVL